MKQIILLAALALFTGGCTEPGAALVASDVMIKKPMPGMKMSAGYLALTNNSKNPLVITDVTSPQFEAVEMHETIVEDGVSRMIEIGDLTISPGSTVTFEPGGKHLMLMRPDGSLEVVALSFHSGDAIVLTIEVAPVG
jgi:copper(I)-binding protein